MLIISGYDRFLIFLNLSRKDFYLNWKKSIKKMLVLIFSSLSAFCLTKQKTTLGQHLISIPDLATSSSTKTPTCSRTTQTSPKSSPRSNFPSSTATTTSSRTSPSSRRRPTTRSATTSSMPSWRSSSRSPTAKRTRSESYANAERGRWASGYSSGTDSFGPCVASSLSSAWLRCTRFKCNACSSSSRRIGCTRASRYAD